MTLSDPCEQSVLPRGLPVEIYHKILSDIVPTVHIDKAIAGRQFLSVESLEPPDPSRDSNARDANKTIGNFRTACASFGEIGAPFLFNQVATRFSRKSLKRLEDIAGSNVARHVKRFTYLVPYFFEHGLNDLDGIKEELRLYGLKSSALRTLRHNAEEQKTIISREEDVRALKKAMDAFTSLQLIQLLRITEREDRVVLDYLRDHPEARQNVSLDWTSACSHASQTLGIALLAARTSQPERFSLPMASPMSARFLKISGRSSVSALAERLTCLTLHFDDSEDLDEKVHGLSELFKEVFTRAKKMKAVHIGFPQHRPLTLHLEDVFHHVTWEDLIAFGIQAWELDAAEITALLGRHRNKLRGVRLRDVHLKEGSRWKDVLGFLHDKLPELKWVSLRRIGYTAYYHSPLQAQHAGTEIPDIVSESEDEVDPNNQFDDPPSDIGSDSDAEEEGYQDEDADSHDESDDENGPGANDMEFPNLNSPTAPTSTAPWCNCTVRNTVDSAEELDDDEFRVDHWKRKRWEGWVLNRCPEHGIR